MSISRVRQKQCEIIKYPCVYFLWDFLCWNYFREALDFTPPPSRSLLWLGATLGIPTPEHLWVFCKALLIPAASASTAQCWNNYNISRGLKLGTSNLKRALLALHPNQWWTRMFYASLMQSNPIHTCLWGLTPPFSPSTKTMAFYSP